MADRRFTNVTAADDGFMVQLAGAPGEAVTLGVYDTRTSKMLPPVTATIGADGTTAARVGR